MDEKELKDARRYKKGKIYKIYSPSKPEIEPFYGVTIEKYLSTRFSKHKQKYKKFLKEGTFKYCQSFKVLAE